MQTPAPVEYERPASLEDAISSLQGRAGGARIIAGGHSLIPMMKLRLATPELLIDINDLSELSYIRYQGGGLGEQGETGRRDALQPQEIRIGALTRHAELLESELLAERLPAFRDAEQMIADPPVRNRGTIGGSLCQADAAEDLSAVCSALKATVVLRGPEGQRVVSLDEFYVGPFMTAVGEAEILTEVRIPLMNGMGSAHEKVERRAGDFAIAAVSAAVRIDGGQIVDAGIGLSALGPTTLQAHRAADALRGNTPGEELFEEVGKMAAEDCSPLPDGRGPVDYKRHLAGVLTKRALRRATARALRHET